LLGSLLKQMPEARWHQYEPAHADGPRAGARLAFGEDVGCHYRIDRADVILSLDADFLACGPGQLRYVHDFAERRRVRDIKDMMNRLYAVESTPTVTGASADHRLPLRPSEVEPFARAVAAELARQLQGRPAEKPGEQAARTLLGQLGTGGETIGQSHAKWIAAAVKDLLEDEEKKPRWGRTLVIAGDEQPAAVHALAHVMNRALRNDAPTNPDGTVVYTDPVEARPVDQVASLRELVEAMDAGQVKVLLILGGNPVFTAPRDLHFTDSLAKVPLRFHLGLYDDETAVQCHWHVAEAHFLEAWGDARAYDGTASIQQPLIEPLYNGRSALELVAALTDYPDRSPYEMLREHWRGFWNGVKTPDDFEKFWQRSLHDGVVRYRQGDQLAGTALPPRQVSLKTGWADQVPASAAAGGGQLEVVFRSDPGVYDGRFANNGWLQEWPRPLTRLTWDNAALISPNTADRLRQEKKLIGQKVGFRGGEHGDVWTDKVRLRYGGQELEVPVLAVPGHPDDTVTLHFGYGRSRAGKVGTGTGFDVYRLRTAAAPWSDAGVVVERTGRRYQLACVQYHNLIDLKGRDPVKERRILRGNTLTGFREDPNFAAEEHRPEHDPSRLLPKTEGEHGKPGRMPLSLYPAEHPSSGPHPNGPQWGMAIDLTACVGCGACVVACQAENNIPVVGKREVTRGREMHWLRIDRYYAGDPLKSETITSDFQPVPCMQCENAPCELVCPVEATAHSDDGLNDMVYNRCVGTRYCSNNCPYKVRRFNFFQYADFTTPSLKLLHNPDVTVRSRGVMEKCTYCVQRIRGAMIEAGKHNREVKDGEILTACQASCPAGAIVFGNINDAGSQVARLKKTPLNYGMLQDLNTRPRTTYLAALRNPNPELGTA
jgi:Fe-S-cluster-containing dehydrogenase component